MKKLLLLPCLWLFFVSSYAQTITMPSSGSTSACSGTFLDPGGTGDYGNSSNHTYTICSSTPGLALQVVFTMFQTESNWDYLYIYNGNSTAAPLIGTYTGTVSPGTIISSNANNCLTFRFTSDGSVTYPGWSATISCVTPPPPSITMTNGSISTCSNTFLDPGGTGDYGFNQNITYTICPGTSGAKIIAAFTMFQTENNWDFLYIYDGNSTSAPLIGTYSGTAGPGTVQASASNTSGCLTFRFTSDGSVTYPGWSATISCQNPCQSITANFISANEAPGGDGIIRICQGQSVNFVGSGTFGTSGTGATYTWSMGNGATVNGTNINYTYTTPGAYLVNMTVTDPNGCTSSNAFDIPVQVSTTPTITTSANPTTLCAGQTSQLNANVTMTPYVVNCTPPVSGVTFLPDGSGVSYESPINVSCYNAGASITSASQISNVCLNMEHSYLGDLEIVLICPSGQSVTLKSYSDGGGGTYLGAAIDDLTSGPGVGSTYCFTPTATTLLVNGPTVTAGSPAWNSIAPGNYMPTQSFNSLIGCPMNGPWTIRVTDNLYADDGYIFNWDLNFTTTPAASTSFTPTIVSQGWVSTSGLTSVNSTTANVTPMATGTPCYTYQVVDNFGCTYSQNQCVTVNCTVLPIELTSFDIVSAGKDQVRLAWETSSEQNNDYFIIRKSATGYDSWTQVALVDAVGDSDEPSFYTAVDEKPLLGVSYYELSQVDLNGQVRVHEMRSVTINQFENSSGLHIYPNPANDRLFISGDFSENQLRFMDAVGKQMDVDLSHANASVVDEKTKTVELNIAHLKAGIYLIYDGRNTYSFVKR